MADVSRVGVSGPLEPFVAVCCLSRVPSGTPSGPSRRRRSAVALPSSVTGKDPNDGSGWPSTTRAPNWLRHLEVCSSLLT